MKTALLMTLLAVSALLAGAASDSRRIEVRLIRALDLRESQPCSTCEARRLSFFDGSEHRISVERLPGLVLSIREIHRLVATEMRTAKPPERTYWEVRALVVEGAQPRVHEFITRHPGSRILADFGKRWFAVSDTELLREALVVARELDRKSVMELSLAIGAPTEWHKLDLAQWSRDQKEINAMSGDPASDDEE